MASIRRNATPPFTAEATTAVTAAIPEIAIQWIVKNACISNTALATLSNVSPSFRRVICATIREMVRTYCRQDDNSHPVIPNDDCIDDNTINNTAGYKFVSTFLKCRYRVPEEYKLLASLLLPDMALEICRRNIKRNILYAAVSSKDLNSSFSDESNKSESNNVGDRIEEEDEDDSVSPSCCLAWFPPMGIQIQTVRVGAEDDDDSSDDGYDFIEEEGHNDPIEIGSNAILDKDINSIEFVNDKLDGTTRIMTLPENQSHHRVLDDNENDESTMFTPLFGAQSLAYGEGEEDSSFRGGNELDDNFDESNKMSENCNRMNGNPPHDGIPKKENVSSSSSLSNRGTSIVSKNRLTTRRRVRINGVNVCSTTTKEKNDTNVILQTCSHEWMGYRDAMDVLLPFGYSTDFARKVLSAAADISLSILDDDEDLFVDRSNMRNENRWDDKNQSECTNKKKSKSRHTTTFAVRGATLARPEGFCLCWDEEEFENNSTTPNEHAFRPHCVASSALDCLQTNKSSSASIQTTSTAKAAERMKQQQQLQQEEDHTRRFDRTHGRVFRKLRRDRMKQLLPRMIMSTKIKNHHFQGEDCAPHKGKRQRCLQFLNAKGTHAVFLRTPPFDCGPVSSPVTIFCVGIATEDGCFVSGLTSRFEFGHLYPKDDRDLLTDMSSICIATTNSLFATASGGSERGNDDDGINNNSLLLKKKKKSSSTRKAQRAYLYGKNECGEYRNGNDDDSDSSNENERRQKGDIRCACVFQNKLAGGNDSSDDDNCYDVGKNDDDNEEDPEEQHIFRGTLGPGFWHCYTAIFDGSDSTIRMDGVTEPRGDHRARNQREKNICHDDDGNQRQKEPILKEGRMKPQLDGLTIGSDHCFDMSLCYGDGGDGEGEGGIAELVVFKGRLDMQDLIRMEQYLMKRHGIPNDGSTVAEAIMVSAAEASSMIDDALHNNEKKHVETTRRTRIGDRWQEDEYRKQAHALMVQPPPFLVSGSAVPLRIAASHRSVAWDRSSDVTGKYFPVSRIGSKLSTGSSDW